MNFALLASWEAARVGEFSCFGSSRLSNVDNNGFVEGKRWQPYAESSGVQWWSQQKIGQSIAISSCRGQHDIAAGLRFEGCRPEPTSCRHLEQWVRSTRRDLGYWKAEQAQLPKLTTWKTVQWRFQQSPQFWNKLASPVAGFFPATKQNANTVAAVVPIVVEIAAYACICRRKVQRSTITQSSAKATCALGRDNDSKSASILQSWWHMPRNDWCFERTPESSVLNGQWMDTLACPSEWNNGETF